LKLNFRDIAVLFGTKHDMRHLTSIIKFDHDLHRELAIALAFP
jgi:hypothetical protein